MGVEGGCDDIDRPMTAAEIVKAAIGSERHSRIETSGDARKGVADHRETLVARIVAEALNVEDVPFEVPFATLGGDSLAAARVLSRAWRTFGVKLPLSALSPDVSVRALSAAISRAHAAGSPKRALVPGLAGETEELSANQAAIWFNETERGAGALYNIPHCLRLRGVLDAAALREALGRLVVSHEALRLGFEQHAGRVLQSPCEAPLELELPIVDLSGVEPEARGRSALDLANARICAPFDLSRPPLLRALLVRLTCEEHMLVLAVHHLVCDAWSIKLMARELCETYEQLTGRSRKAGCDVARMRRRASAGVCSERRVDGGTPSFLDYVAWQREALAEAEVKQMVAVWREALDDVPVGTALPTDFRRPQRPSGVGGAEPIDWSAEFVEDLRRCGADHGVTLYMVLVCAFAVVLMRRCATSLVTLGAAVANRSEPSTEGIVGYLANMVPLSVGAGGDPALRELLCRVRSVALFAYDLQALPLAQLVRGLAPPRRPGLSPLFQTAVVLNDLSAPECNGLEASEVTLHTGTSKLDLTCYLEERRSGGVSGYLEYATELFRPDTISRMRADLDVVLDGMRSDPDRRVSAVIESCSR